MPIAADRSCRLVGLALVALALAPAPASALTAEVAKKCRELAIKAHPQNPAGTKAYAQAQQEYFRDCIAKEGKSQ